MAEDAAEPTDGDEARGAIARAVGPAGHRPSRRTLTFVAAPLVVMVIAGMVGDAMAPTLVDSHPAWLIALNARTRNLVLVTNDLDPWTYYGVGFFRLLLSDPLFFLLGWWYGDAAVRWMERRTHTWGDMLRQVERWFGKAGYPLVFAAPNNYICLFAGAAGMPVKAFLVVNMAGTLFRLYLVRQFGEAFESPIDGLVDWIGDHRGPLLVVTVALVVVSFVLEAKKGETEVTSLTRLEDEIDREAAEGDAASVQDAPVSPEDGAAGAPEDAGGDGHQFDRRSSGP